MTDYVKQLIVPKETVRAAFEGQKAIHLTLMTFDKNVHKVIVPVLPQKVTPLMMYDIDKVLVFFWFDNRQKILQINGQVENETVAFVLPDELRGYPGPFYIEVDLVLNDDRTLTLAQFQAETRASNADMIPENVIREARDWYFQLFEEWAGEVGSAKEDAEKDWLEWKKQREEEWKKFEKNFTTWKEDQGTAQTAYETATNKRWDDWKTAQDKKQTNQESAFATWKTAQEKKQTDHEAAFTTWKTGQEKKQTDFESSVNTKHTAIDKEITDLDKKLDGINADLTDLDAYSKAEMDTKLATKANTTDVAKKADKTEVDKKANQADLKVVSDQLPTFAKKGTRTFLTPAEGFENFHDETNQANASVWLQYIVQGNIGMVFGTVKNKDLLAKNTGNVEICTLPANLKIITGLKTSCVGVNSTRALLNILSSDDGSNPNKVMVSRVQNETGMIEAEPGTRFDIFGAFLVESGGGLNLFSVTDFLASPIPPVSSIPTVQITLKPNTAYTLSTNIPWEEVNGKSYSVFILAGEKVPSSFQNARDGLAVDEPRTITTDASGVISVGIRRKDISDVRWWVMLNEGGTPWPWEPNEKDM